MPILSEDIKLLKSAVMTDFGDGGGPMTPNEVVDGQSNNAFEDVSTLDRTYGSVSLRQLFLAIQSAGTDIYLGARVIVSKVPADPRVNAIIFSLRDWFARRDKARDKIEQYLARGPKWAGHLLENQLAGQRAIQQAVRLADEEPKVGQGLALVQFEGLGTEFEQFVRVTKVTSALRTFTVQNREVQRKVLTIEISDPLRYQFTGASVEEYETGAKPLAVTRDTRVANAAQYYGAATLAQPALINQASIQVGNIFAQLVPSAQSETPLTDLTATGLSSLYVPGSGAAITVPLNAPISPTTKLYLGSSVMPGTLAVAAGGNTITDLGGTVRVAGVEVGLIEYDKGLLSFNPQMFTYSGSISATFVPAALPQRLADTASISIVQDTRGYNYTITLLPPPPPGSLVVSYTTQGKVYYLYERGDGALRGADAAFGTGNLSFTTGTVIFTAGALPDAGSEIIFAWGKTSTTYLRNNITVAPAAIRLQLANLQATPGSVVVTWLVGAVTKTATDSGSGVFTGDATGTINYARSEIKLVPNLLLQKGTTLNVAYQFGLPNEQTFTSLVRDGAGNLTVQLSNLGGNIVPKSVEIDWEIKVDSAQNLTDINSTVKWAPEGYLTVPVRQRSART
jgi:hypothetical protein